MPNYMKAFFLLYFQSCSAFPPPAHLFWLTPALHICPILSYTEPSSKRITENETVSAGRQICSCSFWLQDARRCHFMNFGWIAYSKLPVAKCQSINLALIYHSCSWLSTHTWLGHVIMTPGWDCWDPIFISSQWVTEIPSRGKKNAHESCSTMQVFHKWLQTNGTSDTITKD